MSGLYNLYKFVARHARVIGLVVTGCVAVGVVRGWSAPAEPSAYYATLVHAWHAQTLAHRDELARARATAVTTRTVYVTKRRTALNAVAALPPATLAGDTLHIPAGEFVVAHPVALYVAQLQAAVATIPPVVTSSDKALLATDAVDAAAKVVGSDQTTETSALAAEVKASRPGWLANAFNRLKVPAAFLAGAWLGAKVTR